jgi:hypothetical protein
MMGEGDPGGNLQKLALGIGKYLVADHGVPLDEGLEKIGRQIASRIGLTSLVNIQVKEASDGAPVLLEVKPYFAGPMPLARASGVSMLKLCVDGVLADD